MARTKADLLLHPVRMRIIQSLLGGRDRSSEEIFELLGDVPRATLYRHLNKLLEAGVITVVKQDYIRGGVLRTFHLDESQTLLGEDEVEGLSVDDMLKYFTTFVSSLLRDFESYVRHQNNTKKGNGMLAVQTPLYLSDQEFHSLSEKLKTIFEENSENVPSEERQLRIVTTFVIPTVRDE